MVFGCWSTDFRFAPRTLLFFGYRASEDDALRGSSSRDGRMFILHEIIACLFLLEYRRSTVERDCFSLLLRSLRAVNLTSREF